VRRDIIEIKQQIDGLLSARGRTRVANPEPLRFALLEVQTNRIVERTSVSREFDVVRSSICKIQQALKREQCRGQQESPSPSAQVTSVTPPARKGSGSRE
jgi:hypothetical protein